MFPSFLTRWLLAALLLGLLVASRLPSGASRALARWPRAGLDFVVLPAAEPMQKLVKMLPGLAPAAPVEVDDPARLREQLAWALRQNDQLRAQLRAEREASKWFEQIQPFVKFSEVTPVAAGVATWEGGFERPTLVLSGGYQNGIVARQIVVGAGAELIGVVDDSVSPFSARVRALSWPGTALDCRVVSPNHDGDGIKVRLKANDKDALFKGAFEGDIEREAKVSVGDAVILDDESFGGHARGFVVGKVEKLRDPHPDPNKNLFYKGLVVRPANDLARLSRVIVLVQKKEDAK